MTDSETTTTQKEQLLDDIKELVQYLGTDGLERIYKIFLLDLKQACLALDKMKVD